MRIGIDFDNTIACYDGVFHSAALERGLISADLPQNKNAVRDFLNGSGRKDDFTRLQGYVYGARMDLVSPYAGVADFMTAAIAAGHEIYIVSHKTKTPIMGPAYDMHAAARRFLDAHALAPQENAFFELTKEEKLARARALGLEVFVDDLPEILAHQDFPERARAILFDPDGHFPHGRWKDLSFERYSDWSAISRAIIS
jgi:hypothetical protein